LIHRSTAVDSWRLGRCGTDGLAIADYRIICVVRRADGHLRAVGYNTNGNEVMYDDLWSVAQARQAIEAGHRLYTVSPATGKEADLELHGDGIRTRRGEDADHSLEDLPPCG
jgi:hypothetical protein